MSDPWNDSHDDAHDDAAEGRQNEVVVAGAGTGKTFALVHDYLFTMLGLDGSQTPRSPHRILAITFTDKAAAEMRRRVLLALSELTRNPRANPAINDRAKALGVEVPDAKTLQALLGRVPTAPINTFHALTGNLLRDLALRAKIDPGFSILDPADERLLIEETAEAVVIDALAGDDAEHKHEVANLVARFSLRRIGFSKGLVDALVSLLGSLAERGLSAEKVPLAIHPGQANGRVARARGTLDDTLTALSEAADAGGNEAVVGKVARLRSCQAAVFVALSEDDDGSETRIAHAFEDLRSAAQQSFGPKTGHLRLRVLEAMSTLGAALADQVAGPSAEAVRVLLQELEIRVAREKDARGVLGFGDLLLKTRDLVREDPALRARVKAKYDRILVDEYQDTSPVQEDLVALLAEEIGHEAPVPADVPAMGTVKIGRGRLFVVGDPKQSIYGFRGADAALFSHTLQVVTEGTERVPATGVRRTLAQSFRSLPAVCDAVNLIAEASLKTTGGETEGVDFTAEDYLTAVRTGYGAADIEKAAALATSTSDASIDDAARAPAAADAHSEAPTPEDLAHDGAPDSSPPSDEDTEQEQAQEASDDAWHGVSFDDDSFDSGQERPAGALWVPEGGDDLNADLKEAFVIARGVREILFDDDPDADELARPDPVLVQDRAKDGDDAAPWRRPRPRDIAVLVRRHRAAGPIARALSHQGVPARVFGGEGFFGRPEVQDIIAALRLLTEPTDGLAVLSVLRSPLLALTDDDIAALYDAAPPKSIGLTFDQVARFAREALPPSTAARVEAFDHLLLRLRLQVHDAPVATFVDAFVDEGGYAVAIGVEPDASDRLANLEKLRAMTESSRGSAVAAIGRLWASLDDPPRVGPASGLPPDVDAVQVMTIHQAKGLEFPIVVAADLGSGSPRIRDDFLFDPKIGLTVSVAGRGIEDAVQLSELPKSEAPPAHNRIIEAMTARQHAELARVLYVALTRARDHLFLVGEERKSQEMSLRRLIQRARTKDRRRFQALLPERKMLADPPPPRPIRMNALRRPTAAAPPPPKGKRRVVPSALGRTLTTNENASDETAARAAVIPKLALQRERGRQLHQMVARVGEALTADELAQPDLVKLAVRRAARASGLHPDDDSVQDRIASVITTLTGPIAALLRRGADLAFEEPLFGEVEGVVLNGTADIIARLDDETIVIDLKSSIKGVDAETTRLQLAAYAAVVERERDVSVSIGAWRIGREDGPVEPFDADLRRRVIHAICRPGEPPLNLEEDHDQDPSEV